VAAVFNTQPTYLPTTYTSRTGGRGGRPPPCPRCARAHLAARRRGRRPRPRARVSTDALWLRLRLYDDYTTITTTIIRRRRRRRLYDYTTTTTETTIRLYDYETRIRRLRDENTTIFTDSYHARKLIKSDSRPRIADRLFKKRRSAILRLGYTRFFAVRDTNSADSKIRKWCPGVRE